MSERRTRAIVAGVLVVCLLFVLGGQALAAPRIPEKFSPTTGATLGRAGYGFVGGLRMLAGLLLFNRLDGLNHEYYDGVSLQQQLYLVPSLEMIIALDPRVEQAYYQLPWILARNGKVEDAIRVAEDGVRNNPRSGRLKVALAQIVFLFGDDKAAVTRALDGILSEDLTWYDLTDKWTDLREASSMYAGVGDTAMAATVASEAARVDARIHELGLDKDAGHEHEHEGEGGDGAPETP